MLNCCPKFRSVLHYERSLPDDLSFDFSIGYNGKFEIFEKKIVNNRKLKISKIPNVFCEDHWEKNLGQV